MESIKNYVLKLMMVLILIVPLRAVTVNPALCPTNKIAPNRRNGRQQHEPRTFGAFYDLLSPGPSFVNPPYNPGLQQYPDKDDFYDCGDIEDYDENDLSSLTQQYQNQYQKQRGYSNNRFFFGLFNQNKPPFQPDPARPPNYPHMPQAPNFPGSPQQPQRPQRPQRPYPESRPPYSSGGHFGNNPYRPPIHQDPSDQVKPVHEGHSEHGTTPMYRPEVVGGPIGHVVGVTTIKVPDSKPQQTLTRRPNIGQPPFFNHFPQRPTESSAYTTRRPRPRNLNNDSLLSSFIDLLF